MVNNEQIDQIASMLTDDPDLLNELSSGVRTVPKGSWGAAASGRGRSCPSCGAPADPGDKQCGSCDNLINWTGSEKGGHQAESLRCSSCGGPWEQGQKTCKKCGRAGRPRSSAT